MKRISKELLFQLYIEEKLSMTEIAKRLNVVLNTISEWLVIYNIKKRGGNKNEYVGQLSGTQWAWIRRSAIKRKLEFNITQKQAWDLFLIQNNKCALTGWDISLSLKNRTASLDRIDNNKGYIISNVRWVHKNINMCKRKLSDDEFIKMCESVIKYNKC